MKSKKTDIAVIGISAIFPDALTVGSFWENIKNGRDSIREIPETHWLIEDFYNPDPAAPDKTYAKRGGFIPDIPFSPTEFGIPPNIMEATDTAQLIALVTAKAALDDAGYGDNNAANRKDTSVILGVTSAQELINSLACRLQRPVWEKAMRNAGVPQDKVKEACDMISGTYVEWQENSFPGLLGNIVAGRVANRLNLGGTNCIIDAACASSLGALHLAMNELYLGQSKMVVTGGVDAINDIFMFVCFSKTPALSPSGDCRPFSDDADGTILGEGMGMVVLKRREDAERDGDQVYAIIKGVGTSSDGRSKSIYSPSPPGQVEALKRAYQAAGYEPQTIELIEAHGTGTKAGDLAELTALTEVFKTDDKSNFCALGTVKSQIGHTKAASGAAGLVKAILALHHKILPRTIKVNKPSFDTSGSPFYLNTETNPWIRPAGEHPRRASVSSFGFGGSNFHVTLEEYNGVAAKPALLTHVSSELVILSADDAPSLARKCDGFLVRLNSEPDLSYAQIAFESQLAYQAGTLNLALVANDIDDLFSKLTQAGEHIHTNGAKNLVKNGIFYRPQSQAGKIAFLFPGQGSQYSKMGESILYNFEQALAKFDLAEASGLSLTGEKLSRKIFPLPQFDPGRDKEAAAILNQTEWSQPAIGAISVSLLDILKGVGIKPDMLAGHSFGEITALYAADVISLDDFYQIAFTRGSLMTKATSEGKTGSMAAVIGPVEKLKDFLAAQDTDVIAANENSPRQVVLSGSKADLEQMTPGLKELGLKVYPLPVSNAFHSSYVEAASKAFREFLEKFEFKSGNTDVYSNTLAEIYPKTEKERKDLLARHLISPVRFVEEIELMYQNGARTFIEVGPSNVLTRLVSDCIGKREHVAFSTDVKGQDGINSLNAALANLVSLNMPMNLAALWSRTSRGSIEKVEKKGMVVPISGSNYGKPPHLKLDPPKEVMSFAAEAQSNQKSSQPPAQTMTEAKPTAVNEDILRLIQQNQAQTTQAYNNFLESVTGVYNEFTRVSASSTQAFISALSGEKVVLPQLPPAPAIAPLTPSQPAPISVTPQAVQPTKTAVKPAAAQPIQQSQAPAPDTDLAQIFLSVVSEKTGYPVEMLNLDMDMEADLGIDSIKRVEILGALQDELPNLGEPDRDKMAALMTLNDVIVFYKEHMTAQGVAPATQAAPSTPGVDLSTLFLSVVSEKTGYPVEMLNLDMDMEADLGIDSIKRVEILGALQDELPNLGEPDRDKMAALMTLNDVIVFYKEHMTAQGASPAAAVTPQATETIQSNKLPLRGVELVPHKASGKAFAPPSDASVLVVKDKLGFANSISSAIGAKGYKVLAEEPGVIPDSKVNIGAVIDLSLLSALNSAEADDLILKSFLLIQGVSDRLKAQSDKGWYIAVSGLGGSFGFEDKPYAIPEQGGLSGLLKTLAIEWDTVNCKMIDIDPQAKDIESALCEEILSGGDDLEVALNQQCERKVIAYRDLEIPTSMNRSLSDHGFVVVSGGARGVTAKCALALAETTSVSLLLLGRTVLTEEPALTRDLDNEAEIKKVLFLDARNRGELPTPAVIQSAFEKIINRREVRANIAHMEKFGSAVIYKSVDIQDPSSVKAAIDERRAEWGDVIGIIHGAGVIADNLVEKKTVEQFNMVYRTKVHGLRSLLGAVEKDPLELIAFFSSVAGRYGNRGQCDYAVSNEILNKYAQQLSKHQNKPRVVSFNWGPWEAGMVTAELKKQFQAMGIEPIGLEAGPDIFRRFLLGGDDVPVELVVGGPELSGSLTAPAKTKNTVYTERFTVSLEQYPSLKDHQLGGKPVVPMVLVLEWMNRIASKHYPDMHVFELCDVNVLKGIVLSKKSLEVTFTWTEESLPNGQTALNIQMPGLVDYKGLHYRARLILDVKAPTPPAIDLKKIESANRGAFDEEVAVIYNQWLFHGPTLETIDRISGFSLAGMTFELTALDFKEKTDDWQTQSLMLDGGAQAQIVYHKKKLNEVVLPTCCKSFQQFAKAEGKVLCHLEVVEVTPEKSEVNLYYVDSNNQLVAVMRSLVGYTLPNGFPQKASVA